MRIISETKKMIDDKEIAYLKISDDQQKIRYVSLNTSSEKYKVLMDNKGNPDLCLDYLNTDMFYIKSKTQCPYEVYRGVSYKPITTLIEEQKSMYQQYLDGKIAYQLQFDMLQYTDCYIFYGKSRHTYRPVATKSQFDDICVTYNNRFHILTPEEENEKERIRKKLWFQKNREKERIRKKQYYKENRERILEKKAQRAAEKIKCGCGIIISRGSKSKHLKTKKHKDIIEGLTNDE